MSDYVLSATLDLKDRFSSKIENSFKKSREFQKRIEKMDEKLKKFGQTSKLNKIIEDTKKMEKRLKKIGETPKLTELQKRMKEMDERFKKFGQTPKLKDFEKEMDRAIKKIDQAKVRFSNLGNPLKTFESGISKSANIINNIAGKMWKFTKWGVIGGTGLGIGALKIGADYETLKARMTTAFENNEAAAAEHFIWGNKFANDTPFSNDEVLDAMIKLKNYGYTDPRRLMTMIGDFAAAFQRPLDDAVEAYADAANNQFDRMTGFGIKRESVLEYAKNVLKDPIPMKGQEIANMDKFMKALEKMIKARSKDGMKNAMKTLNGMVTTTSGLIKSSVSKLVGLTDNGEVRAGSLMDRVKEKFEKFNNYMQSSEGQKAVDDWAKGFVEAIPKIIKIIDNIKEKIKEIAGEDFMEKLNNSIKKFDPKSFNQALDEVQKKIDKITDRALRLGGAFAGIQLMKINPYLGALAMVGGAFTPELIKAGEKTVEYLEPTFDYNKHRKEMLEKLKLEEKKVPIRIQGASEEINKELDDYFNKKPRNTGVQWNGFGKRVGDLKSENDEIMNFIRDREEKRKEQKINITNNHNNNSYTIKIDGVTNPDDKVAFNNLSKEIVKAIEEIADKRIDKSMSILADGLNFG